MIKNIQKKLQSIKYFIYRNQNILMQCLIVHAQKCQKMLKSFCNYVRVVYGNKNNIVHYFFISILITTLFLTILCIMAAQYFILQEPLSGLLNEISQFLQQAGIINIRHPSYLKDEVLLFVFYGYNDSKGFISFDIAFASCVIITCNCFDRWISKNNNKKVPKLADVSLLPLSEH